MATQEENKTVLSALTENRNRLLLLAERHLNPVLKSRISAEDVVQEMSANICNWSNDFIANENLPAYFRLRTVLLQTLTRLERFHLKTAKRDCYREEQIPKDENDDAEENAWDAVPATGTSPLSAAAREDRNQLLRQVLQTLSEQDRQIVVLRNFDDLSNLECATILGIEPKAASIRYVRALQRLHQKLLEFTEFQS